MKKKTKAKKKEVSLESIVINFTCDGVGGGVAVEACDFHSSESECDLCGSHGSMSVDFKCTVCGNYHTIELKEW